MDTYSKTSRNLLLWNDGKEEGPYTEADLRFAVAEGTISDGTLSRLDTEAQWKPLSHFLALGVPKASKEFVWTLGKAYAAFMLFALVLAGVFLLQIYRIKSTPPSETSGTPRITEEKEEAARKWFQNPKNREAYKEWDRERRKHP